MGSGWDPSISYWRWWFQDLWDVYVVFNEAPTLKWAKEIKFDWGWMIILIKIQFLAKKLPATKAPRPCRKLWSSPSQERLGSRLSWKDAKKGNRKQLSRWVCFRHRKSKKNKQTFHIKSTIKGRWHIKLLYWPPVDSCCFFVCVTPTSVKPISCFESGIQWASTKTSLFSQ